MKIVIVGAGPAGLFAAYKLAGKADIIIIDKGRDVNKRKCPGPDHCVNCYPCNILSGIGGAGLLSDGKINFSTKIGNNLDSVAGEKTNKKLVKEVRDIFNKFGIKLILPNKEKIKKINNLRKKARVAGGDFFYSLQVHIGTDKLKELILEFRDELKKKRVKFICDTEVGKITNKEVITNKGNFLYDKLILAPGRTGASWLKTVVKDLKIDYSYNAIDIGVRVEVPREITDDITNISRDMKIYLKTKSYDDNVRTFCTCPGGKVARETHGNFNLVNGHSDSDDSSDNTNFAFLVSVPLTAPLSNTNKYGEKIADLAYVTGVKKPILQRLGDLRRGRRSNFDKKEKFLVTPTLNDVVYGDIGLILPFRITKDIIEGLEQLDDIVPGVANDETLLYAPEIKFHGLRIKTDECLRTNLKDIFVAGDGAGLSRGINGAACCGILAANGILRDMKR